MRRYALTADGRKHWPTGYVTTMPPVTKTEPRFMGERATRYAYPDYICKQCKVTVYRHQITEGICGTCHAGHRLKLKAIRDKQLAEQWAELKAIYKRDYGFNYD